MLNFLQINSPALYPCWFIVWRIGVFVVRSLPPDLHMHIVVLELFYSVEYIVAHSSLWSSLEVLLRLLPPMQSKNTSFIALLFTRPGFMFALLKKTLWLTLMPFGDIDLSFWFFCGVSYNVGLCSLVCDTSSACLISAEYAEGIQEWPSNHRALSEHSNHRAWPESHWSDACAARGTISGASIGNAGHRTCSSCRTD